MEQETLFGNLIPPKKTKNLFTEMVDIFHNYYLKLTEEKYIFTVLDGTKIKSLIKKITISIKNKSGKEPTNEEVTDAFKLILLNLPDFYQGKDLKTIDGGYNNIISYIKTKNNQYGSKQQQADNTAIQRGTTSENNLEIIKRLRGK